jgi:hypothetical protein
MRRTLCSFGLWRDTGLGCNRADARHIGKIDSEDSIQLTAEVERLRLIPAPYLRKQRRLGCMVRGWVASCKERHSPRKLLRGLLGR